MKVPVPPIHPRPRRLHGKPSRPNGKPSRPNGKPSRPHGKPSRPDGKPSRPNGKPSRPDGKPSRPNGKPSRPFGWICNPAVLNIRIFNPDLAPFIALQMLIFNAVGLQIRLNGIVGEASKLCIRALKLCVRALKLCVRALVAKLGSFTHYYETNSKAVPYGRLYRKTACTRCTSCTRPGATGATDARCFFVSPS